MSPKKKKKNRVKSRPESTLATSSLESLLAELKDEIFSHLSQETLHSSLFMCPALHEAATVRLYRQPSFLTTYRFAQFVTTVSHCKGYAVMARIFQLDDTRNEETDFAAWREWKCRTSGLYAAQPAPSWALASARKTYGRKHPLRNHFLSKGNDGVPIGTIIQVLAAC